MVLWMLKWWKVIEKNLFLWIKKRKNLCLWNKYCMICMYVELCFGMNCVFWICFWNVLFLRLWNINDMLNIMSLMLVKNVECYCFIKNWRNCFVVKFIKWYVLFMWWCMVVFFYNVLCFLVDRDFLLYVVIFVKGKFMWVIMYKIWVSELVECVVMYIM